MNQGYIAETRGDYDARWVGPHGDILIEVKRTNNARDVRGALLALAYSLEKESANGKAMLVLTESKLSSDRLREELNQFRNIVKDEVGRHIHLVAYDDELDEIKWASLQCTDDLALFIHELILHEMATLGGRVSRVFVQSLIVDRWLQGRSMKSTSEVLYESKASKPTVIAALDKLKKLNVIAGPFGSFAVKPPSWDAWQSLARDLKSERKTFYFADPSGLARGPSSLLGRLPKVMERANKPLDVAVGGVLAAYHYFKDLNITAAPRLDLSVYDGNTKFVRKLDAGMIEVEKGRGHASLVLHLGRRIRTPLTLQVPMVANASPLECLADLLEIGLTAEAQEFAQHLNRTTAEGVELR